MRRVLLVILDWAREILPPAVGEYFARRRFIRLLVLNIAIAMAAFHFARASKQTIEEFGSAWGLTVLCAALAENDLIQRLYGKEAKTPPLYYVIMSPLIALALFLGNRMHGERVSGEQTASQYQKQREEFQRMINSPGVSGGLEIMERLQHASTRPATRP